MGILRCGSELQLIRRNYRFSVGVGGITFLWGKGITILREKSGTRVQFLNTDLPSGRKGQPIGSIFSGKCETRTRFSRRNELLRTMNPRTVRLFRGLSFACTLTSTALVSRIHIEP